MMTHKTKPQDFANHRNAVGIASCSRSLLLLTAIPASAQTPGKAPTLTMAAVPLTTAQRASQTMVNLNFRIPAGYHINSNTPKSEFLIPTALKMDCPPTSSWERLNILPAKIGIFRSRRTKS